MEGKREFSRREFLQQGSLVGMAGFGLLHPEHSKLAIGSPAAGEATALDPEAFSLLQYPAPIPVPEWLEERDRFVFSAGMEGGLQEAADLGVNIICAGTNAGPVGLAGGPYNCDDNGRIYNLRTGEPVDTAKIRAVVHQAHELGMKVIGELMRMWHPQMFYIEHPDWQEVTSPTAEPLGPEHVHDWPCVTGCWNSPFGDFYIRQRVELAQQLDWDGYNLDGWGGWTTCYCRYCQESYRRDTGRDLPYHQPQQKGQPGVHAVLPSDMVNDLEFRLAIKWRLNRYTQFIDRWQRALKKVKPEFVAAPWSTGPGRWWHWMFAPEVESPDAANRLVDAPRVELFWDFPSDQGSNLLPSFTVRYYRGLTAERPVFMLPYFCAQGQQPVLAPQTETDFRILAVLTNGSKVALMGGGNVPRNQPAQYLRHHLDLIKAREPWMTRAESVKWEALLVSESSRLFYGLPQHYSEVAPGRWVGSGVDTPGRSKIPARDRRMPAHMESAVGVFRAALEEHLPLDIMVDRDVEEGQRLNKNRVLVLPNVACLSSKELDQI